MRKLKIISHDEASDLVYKMRDKYGDIKIAEAIGITKMTLYSRLRNQSKWKRAECFLIQNLTKK